MKRRGGKEGRVKRDGGVRTARSVKDCRDWFRLRLILVSQ